MLVTALFTRQKVYSSRQENHHAIPQLCLCYECLFCACVDVKSLCSNLRLFLETPAQKSSPMQELCETNSRDGFKVCRVEAENHKYRPQGKQPYHSHVQAKSCRMHGLLAHILPALDHWSEYTCRPSYILFPCFSLLLAGRCTTGFGRGMLQAAFP